jgi:hypothetical protein
LKLKCDEPLSNVAVNFNLRSYTQEVSNAAWSFAKLGLMPGAEARAALEAAVVRVVGRCRLTVSKSVLIAPMVSALDTII